MGGASLTIKEKKRERKFIEERANDCRAVVTKNGLNSERVDMPSTDPVMESTLVGPQYENRALADVEQCIRMVKVTEKFGKMSSIPLIILVGTYIEHGDKPKEM